MNTTKLAPQWANQEPNVRAVWVGTSESPEWIADHTDGLLRQLKASFGVSEWELTGGQRWAGSPSALANIVREHPVRELVGGSEEISDVLPGEGYSFVVSGAGPRVALRLWIAAGHPAVGSRLPRRRLNIELREAQIGAVSAADGDAVCSAIARSWAPATLALTDSAVRSLARRGNWKIGVGYRTWISSEVGAVSQISAGLTTSEVAGGTMISAPDEWSAEHVVAAMMETLNSNELDEVPH